MRKKTAYNSSAVKRYGELVRLGFTQKSGFSDIVMREISKVVMKKRVTAAVRLSAKKALNLDFAEVNKSTVAYKSDEKFYKTLPKGVRIIGK